MTHPRRTSTIPAPTRVVAGGLVSLLLMIVTALPARAQSVPTGFQVYHVLGHEQQVWDIYENIRSLDPSFGFALEDAMDSIVSMTASSDNQVIYYDHWEDGLEADLLNPPRQATTLVFGNGDPADGRACDFIATRACGGDPVVNDTIFQGENLSLESTTNTGGANPDCGGPTVVTGCVPVNVPGFGTGGGGTGGRDPGYIRFDGGDQVLAAGGPLSMVHLQEPVATLFGIVLAPHRMGGGIEMLSEQAVAGATAYTIPVGVDTFARFGGAGTPGEPFKSVALQLLAFRDGTNVQIVSPGPGGGTVHFTLNAGEHYSSRGQIDGRTTVPTGVAAPAVVITEGTKISTSAPISGMFIAGGDGFSASRTFSILPDILHGNDYVISAPGDDAPAGGTNQDNPANLYLFNPDPVNPIAVTITDARESRVIAVPPGQSVSYGSLTVRDEFTTASYANQDGPDPWSTDWIETDAGPGAAGAGGGNVLVTGGELRLDDNPDTGGQPGAQREVNLLDTDGAIFTFDFRTLAGVDASDAVVVQLSANGGATWSTLETFTNISGASSGSRSYDISGFAAASTRIRFRVSANYGGGNEAFLVDNVQITAHRHLPAGSTARLTSDRGFWGISVYDSLGTGYDWGHSWLSTEFLTGTYTGPRALTPGDTAAIFVAPVFDNTCIRVDLDNDGVFDTVDDGSGAPVPLSAAATCSDGYRVDALGALSVIDPDGDATGARIEADKRVSVAFGLETDTAAGNTANLDLGYAVYPILQLFLDPVMTVAKSADRGAIASAGGTVTYTLDVDAYAFGPLTDINVVDLVPDGGVYVPMSTLITRPDLSTITGAAAEPVITANLMGSGRDQLDWTARLLTAGAPAQPLPLETNERITIRYQVNFPGPLAPGVLRNDARADGTLGASVFSPTDAVDVVVTDVSLTKSVTDDGTPQPGDVLTYTLTVDNPGAAQSGAVITDAIPANTTFCDDVTDPGLCAPIGNAGPFTGSFVGAQNAVVWSAATFPAASGPHALTFTVKVNPSTPSGTLLANSATFESDTVSPFDSNTTTTAVVGPKLVIDKVALGNPNPVHPGETVTFDITVDNVGQGTASNLLIQDPVQVNGTYRVDSLQWRLNAGPFQPLTDATDGDEGGGADGRFSAGQAEFRLAALEPGQDITFRFQVTVTGADGAFLANQATVGSDTVQPADTPLVQIPIVGDAVVNGHLYVDTDGNGVQDLGEPNLANVDLIVTNDVGAQFTVTTDASGNYSVTVPTGNGGLTTLDVDESDPDFPGGAVLVTGGPLTPGGCSGTKTDPQTVTAVSPGPVTACDRGFQPGSITITKTSDAPAAGVAPGNTITYQVRVDNVSGVNQSSLAVSDPVPTGTTPVAASTQISAPPIRVTEYFLGAGTGQFTGTDFDLTLNQDLQPDYFVIVQGSAGDGSDSGGRGPDDNQARLTADPFATGELAASGSPNVIRLGRGAAPEDWVGVVTVVESLPGAGDDGFVLRDVREVSHGGAATAGSEAITGTWNLARTLLMGGYNGAGCSTPESATANTKVCHVRLFPSGTQTINWTRDAGGATLSDATSTVMAVEWGAGWNVQRVRVQGSNGGPGADDPSEYNTAAIAPVSRDRTWVWGSGHSDDQGIGDASEGVLIALGNGVAQNPSESLVAVGLEDAGNALDFEVWALTHPGLQVDHRFKPDGDDAALQVDVTVDASPFNRMALVSNGQAGTGNAYPRPLFSARYVDPTTVRLERRRSGQAFPAWVQGVSFDGLQTPSTGGAQPALVSGYELPPGASLTVTYQLRVDDPLPGGITQITNTATATTGGEPGGVSDSLVLPVVRPAVSVEPNSAASVIDDGSVQQVSFLHTVTNEGSADDSFDLNVFSDAGRRIDLIDPATGVVLASDSNGDGAWDGAAPNTGTLNPGESASYIVRVTVPTAVTVPGDADRIELRATSDLSGAVSGSAFDEVVIVDGDDAGEADVAVTPDNASFADAGTRVVYSHTVRHLGGSPNDPDPGAPPARAFALQANPSAAGWSATIYQDSNNDGVYTPGADTAITSTKVLAAGAQQRVFVVVDVPAGAAAGDVDRTTLTASFFDDRGTPDDVSDDIALAGTATDTTTVGDASNNALGFNLSGGGSQVVNAGDTAMYPGEITSTGGADRYRFTISPSPYADGLEPPPDGNQPDDGLPHTTELVLDTDGNGVLDAGDRVVAVDTDGDGVWDLIDVDGDGTFDTLGVDAGMFDQDGDGVPDLAIAPGAMSPFELRRPVHADQGPYSDPVTLTVTSVGGGGSDAVTVTTAVQSSTLAVVEGLAAFRTPDGVQVRWTTRSEHGTVGFTLQRLDAKRNRWRRVNARLLPALMHSRHGGEYRLRDRGVRAGQTVTYRLRELEATGNVLLHGPYTVVVQDRAPEAAPGVSDAPLPGYQRVARAIDQLARERIERKIAARHAALLARLARRGPVVRVTVDETGMHRLGAARIAAAMGIDEDAVRNLIRRNRLQLRHAGKRVTTHSPDGESLLFHGQAPDSPYTRESVYLLKVGTGYRMAAVNARNPAAAPGQSHSHTAHAEGNRYYLTHLFDDPDDDWWMWDFRFEDMHFDSNLSWFVVPTPDPVPDGTATVTVRLHGGLEATHRARITLAGADPVDSEWQGLTPHTVTFEVPASTLAGGEARVAIDGLGSGDPERPSTFYINDVDVTYTRRHSAHDGELALDHTPRRTTTIDGFADEDVLVFDITDPLRVRRLTHPALEHTPAGVRVSVNPRARSVRRVLAVERAQLREPLALVADRPSLLRRRDHSVDWLLITAGDMLDAAETLAAHRRGQGLRTMVVDVEDIYDEFAHGMRDAEAIWRFLHHAHRRWRVAPRYVVLAGEGSFDYKDHLGHGDSIIPTLLAPTADGLFPSDNLFADVAGNDFLPDMAIGRLPVIDAAELAAVSAKIIAYEASGGAWTGHAVFGADPPDAGGDFAASSERIRDAIPPGAVALETLDVDPDRLPMAAARARLHASLNEGRAFLNFIGHAATGSLGNLAPGLINAGDLASPTSTLDNGDNLPVVTAFTCLVGQFGAPGADGVGELLLVTPDRGAAAVWSPSGLSRNVLAETLGEGFYQSTYGAGEMVIGDVIRGAQAHYREAGGDLYLLDIYNLLGDPATIIK